MFSGRTPSSKVYGRIALFFVVGLISLTITAAGTNAAGFSFMDSLKSLVGYDTTIAPATAISASNQFTLSVSTVSSDGTGTIRDNQGLIDCGSTCSALYDIGSVVTLTAFPDASSRFVSWTGDCACTGSTCDVTMDGAKSCAATFGPSFSVVSTDPPDGATGVPNSLDAVSFTFTAPANPGTVTAQSSSGTCTGSVQLSSDNFATCVALGSPVSSNGDTRFTLTVPPFTLQAGQVYQIRLTVAITSASGSSMSSDFTQPNGFTMAVQHALSVSVAGAGSGRATSNPTGIVCPGDCTEPYDAGTVVTITATADPGSSFSHWTGEPCAGLPENCDVTMSQARSVTAHFSHNDLSISSNGTIPPGTYRNIAFAQTGSCMTARLGGSVFVTGTMTVDACNALDTDGHIVSGSGSFVLGDGGMLYVTDPYGITTPFSTVSCPVGADCGSIQTSSRSFSSSADYTYNGATDQIVGNALPEVVRNLYIVSPPSALTHTRVDGYSPQTVTGELHITGSSSSSKKEFKGHVTLLKRGTGTCDGEIDVYNNVVIDAHGILTLGCDVIVTGDWTMGAGGALSGDHAVTFNGSTGEQDITGDTTFYKLQSGFIYATSPNPVPLRVHGTITITNTVLLFGGQSDLLLISGTGGGGGTPNTPFSMCATGERHIIRASVSDADAQCSGAPVTALSSVDNGNNQNWFFGERLTVSNTDVSKGTVTSQPAGISCGTQCSSDFADGSVVTLTAAPSSGSSFAGWTGACNGTGACDVTMDQARSVTATFSSLDYVVSSSGPLPSGTYRDVTFSGCFVAVMSGDITITGTMTVASCQTLDTNGHIVFGSGSFVLGSGGALYISDPSGITKRTSSVTCPNGQCGSIQTETRSYSSSGDYTYNGLTNQLVGDGLPETVHDLRVLSPPSATTETRLDGYSPQVVTGKITVSGVNGPGKKEYVGHVTLLKRPTANSPCASDNFHDVEILAGGKMTLGCDVSVSGDWTMATGGELSGAYCVSLDGSSMQRISGSTTFSCLSKNPSSTGVATALTFSTGRTTVTSSLTLHGAPGSLLTLDSSSTPGSPWELCALGTRSVDYVSVSNSDARCGATITATHSLDRGGNMNWSFPVATPTSTSTSTPTSTPTNTATNTSTPTPTPTCSVFIPVSMPNVHAATNSVVTIPVTTGDISVQGVLSTDIEVTFDTADLSLPGGSTFGVTMGSVATSNGGGRVMDAFSPSPGTLRVSIYGTQPMIGSGDLVHLTFNVIGAPGASSPLTFSLFRYNENSPCTSTTNGSVTISGSVSGTVIYGNPVTGPNPRGVPNVLVSASSSSGSPFVSTFTDAMGRYTLTGFGSGSYTVTPSKSGGSNGAISSLDAARIAQYVTGRITFTSAQLFVADVTGTSGVTSFDAAMIARFVAALGPPYGNTGLWRFGPSSRSHSSVSSHITGEDYFAHLMGEVSGNWGDPSPYRPAFGPERLAAVAAPRIETPADKEVIVPISIDGATGKDVIAYEFDLRYDPSVIQPHAEPVDLASTLSSSLFAVANAETPGLLRVVVYGAEPLDGNGVLVNLRFTAVGAPGTVSPLTFERMILNEGTPRTTAADGQVELSDADTKEPILSGRLLTAKGEAVANARVTLIDLKGQSRFAISDEFGGYRFGGLQSGQTYTVSVDSPAVFVPLTVSVTSQLTSVDMIAEP
ncbi:MAG: InlB B-repeat-containing protein [Pyrinomonadaceae bacterium]